MTISWLYWISCIGAAWSLQVPSGWTSLSSDRAVLDPEHPEQGEIREFVVSGGKGRPDELVHAMEANRYEVTVVSTEADGTLNLRVDEGLLGRAQATVEEDQARWFVVMASPEAAESLDVHALLTSARNPLPVQLSWGSEVEVLPAGADGSLWDGRSTGQPASGWSVGAGDDRWSPHDDLYGLWKGNHVHQGRSQVVRLTLEATGRARLTRECEGRTQVTEGTWGATGDQLRIAPYTQEPIVSDYELLGSRLTFELDDRTLTLNRIR